MSKLEVNAVEPQCGTNLTLGASGDTIIIPSGATISNQGTAAGFGPTGAVSWDTTKITADPNPAVSGVGYFADTTSAAFTITLPSSPAAGAVVGISDYANTFATNNITVDRNGSNIGGVAENATLSTNGVSITFVYVDATQGWIVTDSGNRSDLPTPEYIVATGGTESCCGDYKIHTFTGPGTFTVTSAGNPLGSSAVDYLVVGGGAGGGNGRFNISNCGGGGGGGAGGFRESVPSPAAWTASPLANPGGALPVSVQGYPITIGGGGPSPFTQPGANGNPSTFSTITSTGGGGGGAGGTSSESQPGLPGGSGGGGGGRGAKPGGSGNTPPTSPSQGSNGGNSIPGDNGLGAGGGGGAGGTGSPAPSTTIGGNGGAGAGTSINPSPSVGTPGPSPSLRYFAGGGGGNGTCTQGTGGVGGGTNAVRPGPSTSSPANSGGGSGGTALHPAAGGSGGSGIVIIRYKYQ
jgi:hypothetical protein